MSYSICLSLFDYLASYFKIFGTLGQRIMLKHVLTEPLYAITFPSHWNKHSSHMLSSADSQSTSKSVISSSPPPCTLSKIYISIIIIIIIIIILIIKTFIESFLGASYCTKCFIWISLVVITTTLIIPVKRWGNQSSEKVSDLSILQTQNQAPQGPF